MRIPCVICANACKQVESLGEVTDLVPESSYKILSKTPTANPIYTLFLFYKFIKIGKQLANLN